MSGWASSLSSSPFSWFLNDPQQRGWGDLQDFWALVLVALVDFTAQIVKRTLVHKQFSVIRLCFLRQKEMIHFVAAFARSAEDQHNGQRISRVHTDTHTHSLRWAQENRNRIHTLHTRACSHTHIHSIRWRFVVQETFFCVYIWRCVCPCAYIPNLNKGSYSKCGSEDSTFCLISPPGHICNFGQ